MIRILYFRWEYYERDSQVQRQEFTLKFGGAQSTGLNHCDCEDANADEKVRKFKQTLLYLENTTLLTGTAC